MFSLTKKGKDFLLNAVYLRMLKREQKYFQFLVFIWRGGAMTRPADVSVWLVLGLPPGGSLAPVWLGDA